MEGRHWRNRTRSHIAPDVAPFDQIEQGQWANLPPELLLDIIRRVEESETTWPARTVVVFCASVCKSWREVTKEIVRTPEECGKLTFPISLKQVIYSYSVQLASCSYCQCQIKLRKYHFRFCSALNQPGPRESPIHCFIKRDRDNSVYRLYFGLTPCKLYSCSSFPFDTA